MPKEIVIALAGNPNCGKTSLFNNLTGTCQHVGNWPGVTVEKKECVCSIGGRRVRIVDLPGTYSLTSNSLDEIVARTFILHNKPDVVINVVDASNLDRNLYLTAQFLEMGVNLVLCLNMIDQAESRGVKIDAEKLSEYLGARVVATVAHRNKGTDQLLEAALHAAGHPASGQTRIRYGTEVEKEISDLEAMIMQKGVLKDRYAPRWLALKLLEGDEELTKLIADRDSTSQEILSQTHASCERLKKLFSSDVEMIIIDQRYGFITGVTKRVVSKPVEERLLFSDRIDNIVLHRQLGIPIFLFLAWLMFKITFTASDPLMHMIESGQSHLASVVGSLLPDGSIIQGLVVDSVIEGVGSVLVFIPLIFILFFLMALLEDSGYMARVAFIMDTFMQKIGLHGKAFLPMILGFGCNIPGLMATRTIETHRERLLTLMIIPFMSCSARLPIYAVFIGAFFTENGGTVLFSLYLLGIVTAVVMAKILGKTAFRGESSPLLLELPPYRMPSIKGAVLHTWSRGKLYLRKAATVILGGCILVWFLSNFPWQPDYSRDYEALEKEAATRWNAAADSLPTGSITYQAEQERFQQYIQDLDTQRKSEKLLKSYAGTVGKEIESFLRPLGFDWKIGISLLTGIVGKEIFVGTLSTLYAVSGTVDDSASLRTAIQQDTWSDGRKVYTPLTAFALMVFCLLYIPCLAAIGTIFQETHSLKWTLFAVSYTTAVAWIVSFLIYQGGRLLGLG